MTSREVFKKALNHEHGPVPIDLSGTAVTGMHVMIVEALRKYYGLEYRPVKVCEPYQMLGLVEEDLAEAVGLDVVGVLPPKTMFGFDIACEKIWRTPWGQDVLVSNDFHVTNDEKGTYIYPKGDLTAPPSGRMPVSGVFFDTIIRQPPIVEEKLDPKDNLEEFDLLTEEDLAYYKRECQSAEKTGKGIILTTPGTGFGDIALVPAPFLTHPKGIRDISEWYISTAIRQDYIHAIFEKQLEIALKNLKSLYEAIGDSVDAVFLCGTDFGTQQGSFCSPDTYKTLWHPYYKKMNDWIHENTKWETFKHSCGAVENFMEMFIDSGFDIINPVQCSAAGMDPVKLKTKYGDRLVFWGGGVDTQHTLPFGTPEEVREQVLERCRIFAENGGFVFDAIHNIQANTPVENIIAMIDAVKEFNRG